MAYGQYARATLDPSSGPVGRFLGSGNEAEENTHGSTQSGSIDLRSMVASTAKHTRRMGTIRSSGVRSEGERRHVSPTNIARVNLAVGCVLSSGQVLGYRIVH